MLLIDGFVNSASMLRFAKKHAEKLWKHPLGGGALLMLMCNDRKSLEVWPVFGVPSEIVYYATRAILRSFPASMRPCASRRTAIIS